MISDSLQAQSTNIALLQVAKAVAPGEVAVPIYRGIENLPHFNPDLDREPALPAVGAFRREVQRADAVPIATPEYAHAIPGALKKTPSTGSSDPVSSTGSAWRS